jgi:5'-nucleotidase
MKSWNQTDKRWYLSLTKVIKINCLCMKKNLGFLFVVFLWMSCHHEPRDVSKITGKTNLIDTILQQDSAIIKTFAPYKEKMIEEVNKSLSYAPKNITRTDGELQSTLGNMMADLMFDKANELFQKEHQKTIDFAFSNYGGIRAGIWQGDVKVIHSFNLMPFDNTIVVAELTKEKTEELFEFFMVESKAHPISKQVQIVIGKGNNIDIKINGKELEDGRTYFVATSNYLQKGGDNMNFFLKPESLYDSDFLVRDAITEYIQKQDTLRSSLDDRIVMKQ